MGCAHLRTFVSSSDLYVTDRLVEVAGARWQRVPRPAGIGGGTNGMERQADAGLCVDADDSTYDDYAAGGP